MKRSKVAERIAQFKAEASRAGFVVYEASGDKDVCSYVLKLAREKDVKIAVKSKSEIANADGLRKQLEKAKVKVVEADFEEWLAKSGGNKGGVSKKTTKAAALKPEKEVATLLNKTSSAIRQYCIGADLGLSEANAGIAETGTLVLAGDEGVTRLVAVLPRIHVTLLDDQNIVSSLEEVFPKLKKPTKRKNSPAVPSYITYITGRNTTADIPGAVLARAQGPAEEHLIVVNKVVGGGRS